MRLILILLCCALAACNTPGPHFRGLDATRVTVDGSTFDVRVRDRLAEALRVNPQYAPRFGPIAGRAKQAIEQVSGCEVTEVRGDQALATGLLECGKTPPPSLAPGQSYACAPLAVGNGYLPGRAVSYRCEVVG
ncbi:hypothetical protein [Sulfitobacter sabulilitoris]|uniref:hypothetical protein n=1 Tax=Sulfitobacter sabulilitoris TaxID=2562655 RepID=UPI001BB0B2C1|nr:hypothetical protein [Sulfitobacter sabulilitoris]